MKVFAFVILSLICNVSYSHSGPIRIAIIDTGLDVSHPYVRQSIWKNTGEVGLDEQGRSRETNGIDDDHNGYVDDIHGWNFAQQNNNLTDQDGHGTHIAGVIKKSTATIEVEFVILKYYNSASNPESGKDSFLNSLKYALKMKSTIINISGGGRRFSLEELNILKAAERKHIVVVAAAGNKDRNTHNFLFYPAAYNLPNIISVVATDESGKTLTTSNINQQKLNIFERGNDIYSSLPGNAFGYKTGSSQAAAIVSGRVATQFYKLKRINLSRLSNFVNTNNL